ERKTADARPPPRNFTYHCWVLPTLHGEKTTIFTGTWQGEPRDTDCSVGGRAAVRERNTADREGEAMAKRNQRTVGRFQVEALEGGWAPTGLPGETIGTAMIRLSGEPIPQVQVAPLGGGGGMTGGFDPTPLGGRTGSGGEV